ncbi:MAG: hypothetical protein IJE43_20315 [Alphaproteobacteria bacterium]|nr:hypothetical protein [Alphaproteobacteria bacterium]
MDYKLTGEQVEMYKRNYPKTGEEDIQVYEANTIYGKTIASIAEEKFCSESTISRKIKKVKDFVEKKRYYYDMNTMRYILPPNILLNGYETKNIRMIATLAISIGYQFGGNCIDGYYYDELLKDNPGIKNKKKDLEEKLLQAFWTDLNTNEKIHIFESVEIGRNRIGFTFTEGMKLQIRIMHVIRALGLQR